MSHNIHEGIRNLSHVSSISLALLFFYFITHYQHDARDGGVCCDPVDPTSHLDEVPERFISVVPF